MNTTQQAAVTAMESVLEEAGLDVEERDLDDGTLSMTFGLSSDDEADWLPDLAEVLGAYYGGLLSQDWNAGIERLVAKFTTPGDSLEGSEGVQITAKRAWAKAYADDDLTMLEFLEKARETAQVVDADGAVHDVMALVPDDT